MRPIQPPKLKAKDVRATVSVYQLNGHRQQMACKSYEQKLIEKMMTYRGHMARVQNEDHSLVLILRHSVESNTEKSRQAHGDF